MLLVFVKANGRRIGKSNRKCIGCFNVSRLEFFLIKAIVPPCPFIPKSSLIIYLHLDDTWLKNLSFYVNAVWFIPKKSVCHRQPEHVFLLSWLGAQIFFYVHCFLPCCLDDHLLSLRMSGSRKEFDVKQILKIRWRWFGHQASTPNSAVDSHQGDFWNRGQNATTGGTKFLDPGNLPLPLASIGYRRSSQQDFQNSPLWPMASTSEVPTFEFSTEDSEGARWLDRAEADDGGSEEENESDSSSCRLIVTFLLY